MGPNEVVARLPGGYRALFDRLVERCTRDERVRAVWLGGSLARGDADQSSDLDVIIAVADESFEDFAGSWRPWLDAITPTVIARELPFLRGSFYSVTPSMERLDVITEAVSALANTMHRVRLLVLDKDGCDARIPAPIAASGPSPQVIAMLVEEFFRDYALFHTVAGREDWLLGLEAIHLIRGLLYRLYVEANAPLPVTGVKRWSEKLTPAQRHTLESLPAARADEAEVMAVHETVSIAFVVNARRICRELGVEWPIELEHSVCAHLAARGLPHLEAAND